MNITVLFFGMLAEKTQTSNLELITNAISVGEFEIEVIALFPVLKNMTFKIAMNENIVSKETKLQPQSRLAFLPPFAGG